MAAKLDFSPLLAASTPSGRVNWAHPPEWSSHEAACPDRQELADWSHAVFPNERPVPTRLLTFRSGRGAVRPQ